jgi:hypothetical protein
VREGSRPGRVLVTLLSGLSGAVLVFFGIYQIAASLGYGYQDSPPLLYAVVGVLYLLPGAALLWLTWFRRRDDGRRTSSRSGADIPQKPPPLPRGQGSRRGPVVAMVLGVSALVAGYGFGLGLPLAVATLVVAASFGKPTATTYVAIALAVATFLLVLLQLFVLGD